MKRYTTDASGTVTIFVIISLAFFLVMGGIAIDLAYFTAVRGELQRSGEYVMRRNVVRNVDKRGVGANSEHHALHCARVMVACAEISE